MQVTAMQTIWFVPNAPPHGSERSDNAWRLAETLTVQPGRQVHAILMADAVLCAKSGQKVPAGEDNIEAMPATVALRGKVAWCGTCMDARGLQETELMPDCRRSTRVDLAQWTGQADKDLVS